jgi:tRNA modification GTPase
VVEERHYNALRRARASLQRAQSGAGQMPLDMLTIDISECWQTLGEITGETANEEIIGEIFSKFCVGK